MRNSESFFFLKKIQRLAHSENFVFTKLVFYKPLPLKKNKKSYQSQQLHASVKNFFPIFVSVFRKLIQKQILYFHAIVPSFFKQNIKFFKSFCTFFSQIKTNSFFNKKQLINLQIAFLKKQRKTQKFFYNLFFNINKKNLKNFLGARKKIVLFEQKEQQKESFSHFLFFLLFFKKQKKCLAHKTHVKAINEFSFYLRDFLQFEKSNYSNFFFQFFKEIQFFLFFILKDFKNFQTKENSLPPKTPLPQKTPLLPSINKFTNKNFEHFQTKIFCLNLTKTRIFQTTKKNLTKKAVFFKKKFTKKIYNLLFFSISNHKLFSSSLQIPNFCFLKQFSEQKKIYQKIQSKNILEFAKKNFHILFEYYETQNFLNLCLYSSENWANFQMIFHQFLKIPFCTLSTKMKNQQNFLNNHLFFLSKQTFLFSKTNFVCLSFINRIHLLPTLSNKKTFPLTRVSIATNQKTFYSFFKSNMQTQNMFFNLFYKTNKTYKNLYLKLRFLHFEKNLFHYFTLSKVKHFSRKKENLSYGATQIFSFSKPLYQNLLASLFLIFESNYSNFLFFNSTFLLFFKKFFPLLRYKKVFSWYLQTKNLFSTLGMFLENFLFFKNFSVSKLYLTKNFQSFHYAKTKKSPFCFWWIENEPFVSGFELFSSSVFKNQKQMQNLFIFQNIYWQFSKKFFFLQTKITKLPLFNFSPLFSCFLGLNYKNLFFFFLAPEKSFLDSPQFLVLNEKNKQGQDLKNKLLRKKAILFIKDQVFLYGQKNFQHFIFENKKFRALNFNGFSVSLIVNYQKQLKNYYIFEKIPTRENINLHLRECKQILKKSIGKKQIFFMKKLHQKILIWCKKYKDISKKQIFNYCDSMLLKFLWNWARKTHPNKSKIWIRKKYFHLIHSNKWFFGKKVGNKFVCLPLHSQITKCK